MFEEPEGATPLDPDEINGLKFKHLTTRGELNELEQVNIQQGLRWLQRRRTGDVLSDEFTRNLHTHLFGDVWSWAGSYRQTEKNIGIDPFQIAVQLHELIENTKYWVEHSIYTPLEAAARYHHRLTQIHPFVNGNGRHARISADILLKDYYDHLPIDWAKGQNLEISGVRRNAYIKALRAADAQRFDLLFEFVGLESRT